MNIPNTRGGSLPVSASALPVSPGGKLSYASYGANTNAKTLSSIRSWGAAPQSLRLKKPAELRSAWS